MKKMILLIVLVGITFSCGTTKTVKNSKKVIKGEWTLNTIAYSNYGSFRMTFFNDVSKNCLEGSDWKFVPNNNTGTYTISKENCLKGDRNFIFTIQDVNPETGLYDFLLKPTDKKNKSVDNRGFRLRLTQLTESEMKWEQTASIDGKTIKIDMNFIKITEK